MNHQLLMWYYMCHLIHLIIPYHHQILHQLLALLGACASPAPTSGPTASPFEVEAPPVWSADGIRIATFNGEFLFDGEGDEGAEDPAASTLGLGLGSGLGLGLG